MKISLLIHIRLYNDYSPLNLNFLLIICRERGNSGFVKLAAGREVGIGQLPGARAPRHESSVRCLGFAMSMVTLDTGTARPRK